MLDIFERAETLAETGRKREAREVMQPLVTMMFPPALGLMATMAKNDGDAAMWGQLAQRGRDQSGQAILSRLASSGNDVALAEGRKNAALRKPKVPKCLAETWTASSTGPHAMKIGPATVSISKSIDPKLVEIVKKRFPIILNAARTGTIEGRLLVSSIRKFQVIGGDRYDRYVEWVPGNEGKALRLTVGNFLDAGPVHTAKAMTLVAQRTLYDRLNNRSMIDPYFTVVDGIRVFTSIYPDVAGTSFIDSLRKSLKMAKKLPDAVMKDFNAVHEIRYNPPSKHFLKFGAPDGAVAYYDKSVSRPGRRVIFVRRDMRWSSHADLLLSIVHEGTHANQDAKAERLVTRAKKERAQLSKLTQSGQGESSMAKELRTSINAAQAYSNL